jgi:riboflavin synthase
VFTGIVRGTGNVKYFENDIESSRITIETHLDMDDLTQGDSISVNGACLTITDIRRGCFTAVISHETIKVTTLGKTKRGDCVNLEKALKPSDSLGGHLVTGHVDGVGPITKISKIGNTTFVSISLAEELRTYVVKKGSITVDGISLTVKDVLIDGFEVSIIPYTIENTTLASKKEGDLVNIETDIIGKYVEKLLPSQPEKKRIDISFLAEHGFIK